MPAPQKRLTIRQILAWADAHHARTGRWPTSRCGPIVDEPGRTWEAVNTALRKGGCGLRGGDTLARLLERRRSVRHTRRTRPQLTRRQIIQWIDDHHQRTGGWPNRDSGPVNGHTDISWSTVDRYLKVGSDHLPGGSSLAALIRETHGVWDGRGKPRLTHSLILKWAEEHYYATGRWPVTVSGRLLKRPDEDWAAIDMALRHGRRGLPGGTSLSQLLTQQYGERYNPNLKRLSIEQVLAWADRHHQRRGRWPTRHSGAVLDSPDITWSIIDACLTRGGRGLPGESSLAQLLDERRRARHALPREAARFASSTCDRSPSDSAAEGRQ